MRTENFSELLNPALTSSGTAIPLYQPNQKGSPALTCNGQQNVICPANIDKTAQAILNMYPAPSTNGANVYNNYQKNISAVDNAWQWGARIDWNLSSKDQMFVRYSYVNTHPGPPSPLGNPLDGGSATNDPSANVAKNLAVSETHAFNSNFLNEFRFGYTAGSNTVKPVDFTTASVASSLGFGGIPSGGPIGGSLPTTKITGIQQFGAGGTTPQFKSQSDYEFLDNVTFIRGNHFLKVGVALESVHFPFLSPPSPFGSFTFSGTYTSLPGVSHTGYGAADFLLDSMNSASISNYNYLHFSRWTSGKHNTISGPGYERVNMSLFKSWNTFREQRVVFRVDAFNLLNTPSWGSPSNPTNNGTRGQRTTPKSFQLFTPDSRFFQLSGKYIF
jgi:hypothetical protein